MSSNNFFTPFVASTSQFLAATMNAPLNALDKMISYMKNTLIECDGNISSSGGTLTWTGTIKIAYLDEDGNAIINTIAASSKVLGTNEFAYVSLNANNGTAITVSTGTLTGASASTFKTDSLLVLAFRGDGDNIYPVALKQQLSVSSSARDAVSHYYKGQPAASGEVFRHIFDVETTFSQDFPLSQASCRIPPSGEVLFYGHREGIGAMQIIFDGATTATFSGESVVFAAGEVLTVMGPDPQDANIEDIGFTFSGLI